MSKNDDELKLPLTIYKPLNFTGGCLEIRLFYVRIAPCAVDNLPDHLHLRHLRRELGVSLEINGVKIPPTDTVSVTLRRDRVDKDSNEVTYVSTDSVKIWGPAAEFEVCEGKDDVEEDLVLCGSLQKALDDGRSGWSMDCYVANTVGRTGLLRKGGSSPSIEVYVAGCCSGAPVILTKTIVVSPRRKVGSRLVLDAIPEDEEIVGKEMEDGGLVDGGGGLVRQRKSQVA